MLDWDAVEVARIADGGEFVLARCGDEWIVRVDERILMSNLMHNSEDELAKIAIGMADDPREVLVGGLGLGYTLRTALDCVADDAVVTVAELVPELVEWNEKHLRELNGYPLGDSRCRVVIGDVFDTLQRSPAAFDVVLLDVDNGPSALAQPTNDRIYADWGVRVCHAALRPGGVLGVWSRGPSARYERHLRDGAFDVDVRLVAASLEEESEHVLFLAQKL